MAQGRRKHSPAFKARVALDVKGGGKLGHGAEQKCTGRALVSSINIRLLRVSSGAVSGSEVGGVYASGESLAERVVTACLLCLRR